MWLNNIFNEERAINLLLNSVDVSLNMEKKKEKKTPTAVSDSMIKKKLISLRVRWKSVHHLICKKDDM